VTWRNDLEQTKARYASEARRDGNGRRFFGFIVRRTVFCPTTALPLRVWP